MVAYNFQRQFVGAILSGAKISTIRRSRQSRHVEPGGVMQIYTGMRTHRVTLVCEARCVYTRPITIACHGGRPAARYWQSNPRGSRPLPWLNDLRLSYLAAQEGFDDDDTMVTWFARRYGLPFAGFQVCWAPKRPRHYESWADKLRRKAAPR